MVDKPGPPGFAPAVESAKERQLKLLLGRFTLSLLKGMMMTGIYPPDHPVIADITSEPFLLLKQLAPDSSEITFMAASAAVGDEIMVEGVLPESVPFSGLLHSSMGEVFSRKFVSYFARNQLVSFSIKTRISKDELQRFISLFVERQQQEEREAGGEPVPYGELLVQAGIFHVSAMALGEMVGKDRPLPWRVRMAISRLRKELRNLPLYSKATAAELAEAKRLLLQDITRPLRRAQFLKELLANTDLVAAGISELGDVDLELEIVQSLHPGMLQNVSWDIVGDLEKASWGAISQMVGAAARRLDLLYKGVLKKIALRLREVQPEAAGDLLQHLFRKRIITFEELPEPLRRGLTLEKWTAQFLNHRPQIEARFAILEDEKTYREYLNTFVEVIPGLVAKRQLSECVGVLRLLRAHSQEASPAMVARQQLAAEAHRQLAESALPRELCVQADTPEKETRKVVLDCLATLGGAAAPALIELLSSSRHAVVRRDVLKLLEALGTDAQVAVMELLSSKGQEWFVYRNAILLATTVACTAAMDDIRRFLSYPHPRVREEAVRSLALLGGPTVMEELLPTLLDPVLPVFRRALTVLGGFRCRHPLFLEALVRELKPPERKNQEGNQERILATVEAMKLTGPFTWNGKDGCTWLWERLQERRSRLRSLLKRHLTEDTEEKIRAILCDALGAMADASWISRLEGLAEDPSPLIRERSDAAIKTIRARAAGK